MGMDRLMGQISLQTGGQFIVCEPGLCHPTTTDLPAGAALSHMWMPTMDVTQIVTSKYDKQFDEQIILKYSDLI